MPRNLPCSASSHISESCQELLASRGFHLLEEQWTCQERNGSQHGNGTTRTLHGKKHEVISLYHVLRLSYMSVLSKLTNKSHRNYEY